jgi:hypothetical protein
MGFFGTLVYRFINRRYTNLDDSNISPFPSPSSRALRIGVPYLSKCRIVILGAVFTECVMSSFVGPAFSGSSASWHLMLFGTTLFGAWLFGVFKNHSDEISRHFILSSVCSCVTEFVTLIDSEASDPSLIFAVFRVTTLLSVGALLYQFPIVQVSQVKGEDFVLKLVYLTVVLCFVWALSFDITLDPSMPRTVMWTPTATAGTPPAIIRLLLGCFCSAAGCLFSFFIGSPSESFASVGTCGGLLCNIFAFSIYAFCKYVIRSEYYGYPVPVFTGFVLKRVMGPFCNALGSFQVVCVALAEAGEMFLPLGLRFT